MRSVSFKKKHGVYYTNSYLAKKMISLLGIDYQKEFKLIELAIGEGHIMMYIVQRFLKLNKNMPQDYIIKSLEKNFYGFDIREDAILLCKKKLNKIVSDFFHKDIKIDWKIYCSDVLELKLELNKFDYVISNPPFISKVNMPIETINFLKNNSLFCNKYNYNFYYYFFEVGYELWNKKGKMVFVTPNTYLKAESARIMNSFFLKHQLIEKIVDFDYQLMFENASVFTAITVFSNNNSYLNVERPYLSSTRCLDYKNINIDSYNPFFHLKKKQYQLGDIAKVRNGIATLNDKTFIISSKEIINLTGKYIIFKKNNKVFKIERKILLKGIRPSNVNEINYVIFPYDAVSKKKIDIDNMKYTFPLTYRYLDEVLPQTFKDKYGLCWGRSQGIYDFDMPKIVVSRSIIPYSKPFKIIDSGLVISGIQIVPKKYDLLGLVNLLNSHDIESLIFSLSKTYIPKYKSLSTSMLKKIPLSISF